MAGGRAVGRDQLPVDLLSVLCLLTRKDLHRTIETLVTTTASVQFSSVMFNAQSSVWNMEWTQHVLGSFFLSLVSGSFFCSGSLGGKILVFPTGAHGSEISRDNVVLTTL